MSIQVGEPRNSGVRGCEGNYYFAISGREHSLNVPASRSVVEDVSQLSDRQAHAASRAHSILPIPETPRHLYHRAARSGWMSLPHRHLDRYQFEMEP